MSMTPEELAAIEAYLQQLQSDPLARATNDYGQGAGFLQSEDTPVAWDRAGDKVDLLTDFLKGTKTYLPDWIPDLHPEVQDPGQFAGYRSDQADLYRNNPAYNEIDLAMQDGASFDEAVQAVAASPDFVANLPQTEGGDVDLQAFRNSAETYVSERAREGREFDEYDAERQAYEDYVNPRNQWSDMGNDRLDPASMMRRTNYEDPKLGLIAKGFGNAADMVRNAPGAMGPQSETAASIIGRGRFNMDSPMYDGRDVDPREAPAPVMAPKSPARNAAKGSGKKATAPKAKARSAADRNAGNKAYNDSLQAVYDFQKKKQSANMMPSKKQENLAKVAAYYNAYVYGE